jgi:hypothetical protein
MVMLFAFLVVGVLLWDQPWLLPFKLIAVMVHETGHALASLLVGGSVDQVTLALDQSGRCLSLLPNSVLARIVVFSSGYVGAAVAGAALLIATFRFGGRRWVLVAACAWFSFMGLVYAGDLFTRIFCAVMALALVLCARFLPDGAIATLNLFLAAFTALYAAADLRDDLWNGDVRPFSDAGLLAGATGVPALFWALLWSAAAIAVLGLGVHVALREKESPDTDS